MREPEEVEIACADGYRLRGHLWRTDGSSQGTVIVNPATAVLARYYHYYAGFLAQNGFDALTYDYRGIGLSRPQRLRGCGFRWSDWGELDFDAAVRFAKTHDPDGCLLVVGHSFGGFLPGLAESAVLVDRMLTVGAQYAWWRDYAPHKRVPLFVRWHVFMPVVTALCGYFPGRRLGWLEDMPAGVANEWSFRRARMELNHPPDRRDALLRRFAAVTAPILAVTLSDDEYAPPVAVKRGLSYYKSAERAFVHLDPADLGHSAIGHFGLFHSRHTDGFWKQSLAWLAEGANPWERRSDDIAPMRGREAERAEPVPLRARCT
ncbi:serine aminopeptidase domain-containing protein [Microvirga sp. GCM10011540]|uniref:alpha/beta hydrolase family protein n=1 Tax=Microvirga sp. GCM10011540 TaxID=3317338 RepID=UPI003619CE29